MRRFALPLVFALLSRSVAAGDWPDFRGPQGNGQSLEVGLPLAWSEGADGKTQNVAWKVAVPGRGWSSPVVWGRQVWLTTCLEAERSLRALAFDVRSGALLHDVEVFRPVAFQATHLENSHASPAPVVDEGRVYVHFGAYGTAALDTASGAVLWRNTEIAVDHEVGPGSSPILVDDLLVVHFDGTDRQLVAAFDTRTGAIRWQRERSHPDFAAKRGMHRKAFSTPLLVRGDPPLLISPAAAHTVALDASTGEEVWRVLHEGYSTVTRPVAGLGMVFVGTGYMKARLLAIRLGGQGDVTASHVAWSTHWQVPANPSPLVVGDRVFLVSDWGIASWLDAATGEDLWHERLGGRFWASPVHAHGRIYAFADDGAATVLAAADRFAVLATNRLAGRIHASPAFADGAILVRTETHLYRVDDRAP